MTVQPKKKSHIEGDCSICFGEKASHRAVLKHSGRVVKSLLIGEKCLSNDGVMRFYMADGWEMTWL